MTLAIVVSSMLPFRNGAASRAGMPRVGYRQFDDYDLLWRAVDAFAPSPLCRFVGAPRPSRAVEHDLAFSIGSCGLDLESEPVRNLTREAWPASARAHALFMAQTGIEISPKRFSDEMNRCALRPDTPFGDKIKIETGWLYRLKGNRVTRRPTASSSASARSRPRSFVISVSSVSFVSPSCSVGADEGIG